MREKKRTEALITSEVFRCTKRRDELRRGGQSVRATTVGKSGAEAPRGLKTRSP